MANTSKKQSEQQKFQKKFEQVKPAPPLIKNVIMAFLVGGLICILGQFIMNTFINFGLSTKEAAAATSAAMIFIGAFLTGLGIYDEIGKFAGAGSVVPITGFSNSIVSSAMEFKREGYVFGVGAKMFTIAGPVLVYGTVTAFIFGIIYWLLH
jgi:stage V sporulation protein AC